MKTKILQKMQIRFFEQTFCMFKSILKKKVITSYYDKCIVPNNCVSCKRKDLDVRGLVGVDDLEGVDEIGRV